MCFIISEATLFTSKNYVSMCLKENLSDLAPSWQIQK